MWKLVFTNLIFCISASHANLLTNEQIQMAELRFLQEKAQYELSKRIFFPEFYLSANKQFNYFESKTLSSSIQKNAIEFKQNIFRSGLDRINMQHKEYQFRISEVELSQQKSIEYLAVIQNYIQYQLASDYLKIEKLKYEQTEKSFLLIKSQYLDGFKKKEDFLDIESAYMKQKIAVNEAQRNVKNQLLNFETRVQNADQLLRKFDLSVLESMKLDSLETLSIKPTEQLRLAQLNEEEFNLENKSIIRQNSWLFEVDVSGGYGQLDDLINNQLVERTTGAYWSINANFKYPLYDFGQKNLSQQIQNFKNQRDLLNFKRQQKDDDLLLRKLINDLEALLKSYELRQSLIKSESQNRQYYESQFRSGQMSLLTYLNNFDSFYLNQMSVTETLYQIINVKAQIIHYTRMLNEKDFLK